MRSGLWGVAALLALLGAPDAIAQTPPRERTGPRAEPPTTPPFANPNLVPPQVVAPEASQPEVVPQISRAPIQGVRVRADGEIRNAEPPPGWRPPVLEGPVQLAHQPGQLLDAAWVETQFSVNGLSEGRLSFDTALALVQLINRAYLSAGFFNSGIIIAPEDRGDDDILDLQLISGRLSGPVTVTFREGNSKGLDEDYLTSRLPSAERRPLSAIEIEHDFRLLAQDPAIQTVNVDLRPGSRPGEAGLSLMVQPQDRFDLYATFANDRSPSVGGESISITGSMRHVIASGDFLTAEAAFTDGVEDAQLSYSTPILSPRTSFSVRGSFNDAAVIDQPLIPLDIRAQDRAIEAGLTHRLIEQPLTPRSGRHGWSPSRVLSGGALLVYRHQKSFLLGEPFSFAPGSRDGRSNYTALRLVGDYLLRNVDQVFAASASLTFGLDGTQAIDPLILNPDKGFKALLVQLNYARRLTEGGLELRARLTGQAASSVLYSGERLSVGGEGTVRGYRQSLYLVDQGLIGSIELARPFDLGGSNSGASFRIGSFTASIFADGAFVDNVGTVSPPRREIASIGASLMWTPSDALTASIAFAESLRDVPQVGESDLQDRGIHFRVSFYPLRF